jgi:hypothetical protein
MTAKGGSPHLDSALAKIAKGLPALSREAQLEALSALSDLGIGIEIEAASGDLFRAASSGLKADAQHRAAGISGARARAERFAGWRDKARALDRKFLPDIPVASMRAKRIRRVLANRYGISVAERTIYDEITDRRRGS